MEKNPKETRTTSRLFGNLRTAWKAFNGKHCNWFLKAWKCWGKCSGKSLKVYSKWAAIHRWTVKCFRSLQIECHSIRQVLVNTTSNGMEWCEIWAGAMGRMGVANWPPSSRDRKENEFISGSINPNPTGICLSLSLTRSLCVSHCCAIFYLTDHQIYALCMPAYHSTCCWSCCCCCQLKNVRKLTKGERDCSRRRSRRRGRRGELPQLRLEFS